VLRILSRRQECQSTGLSNAISEALAAWILAVFVLGAGLSLLALHERGVRDGVVVPGWRAPTVTGREDWDDPECRREVRSCADLPAEGNITDLARAPAYGGIGW
jgi:hypothetical protein